jgi:starch phosphorylase
MERFLALGHLETQPPGDAGLTPFALRLSRHANAVSSRHGEVARALWQPLYPGVAVDDIPIPGLTNGVHLPSFMAPPMQRLLDEHLGPDWRVRVTEAAVWRAVDDIPAADLWRVRQELRAGLVERVRRHSIRDRLQRGEDLDYVAAAARTFDADTVTVGFARRLATYKRPHLLGRDPRRALSLLSPPNPIQLLLAGKAHPADDQAKEVMQQLFTLKADERVGRRVVVLENYDLRMAPWLTAGCDVWVNLPRPPNEACGTSGMKAMMNGGLNLSVLDGWWAEAWDGANGWAIDGVECDDPEALDDRHAAQLYDLLEGEVVPRFHDRDPAGIPHAWVDMMRASLRTLVPRFCATRMLTDYVEQVYRP